MWGRAPCLTALLVAWGSVHLALRAFYLLAEGGVVSCAGGLGPLHWHLMTHWFAPGTPRVMVLCPFSRGSRQDGGLPPHHWPWGVGACVPAARGYQSARECGPEWGWNSHSARDSPTHLDSESGRQWEGSVGCRDSGTCPFKHAGPSARKATLLSLLQGPSQGFMCPYSPPHGRYLRPSPQSPTRTVLACYVPSQTCSQSGPGACPVVLRWSWRGWGRPSFSCRTPFCYDDKGRHPVRFWT